MEDEQEYYLRDIETGYAYKVTKEQYESFLATWDMCRPKIDNKAIGSIICTGTKGELSDDWWSKMLKSYGK